MASVIAFETYAGKDRTHRITLNAGGAALDLTGGSVTIIVKRRRSDITPLFTMTSPVDIDFITPADGIIDVRFRDTLTDGLAGLYVHEIVAVTAAGEELKCSEGPMNILPSF